MGPLTRFFARTGVISLAGGIAILTEGWASTAALHAPLQRWVAAGSAAFARFLGLPTYLDGATVYSLDHSIHVVPACDGFAPTILVLTGIALLSVRARTKVWLALLAVALVYAGNVVRVGTVLGVGTRSIEGAAWAHDVVFPAIWALVFAALWLTWIRHEAPAAEDGVPA